MARFILRRNAVRERVAREGWRETAVVEKETDICTCFPNPPRPGEKRSGSRPCEEGKERRKTWRTKKRCIYIERETKRERLGRNTPTAYSTRFIRRVISRVTFMTAGRAAFEGIRILKRRAQWGERREGRIKVKPAPPLWTTLTRCPRKTLSCMHGSDGGAFRWRIADNANILTMTRPSENRNSTVVDTRTRQTSPALLPAHVNSNVETKRE